jgi:hypothetical protein
VFITGDERVKVLDFGVALSLDVDSGPITRAAGTPGYMAPEQLDGSTAQDARTDVWAAARLLLECLLGRLTHDASIDGVDAPAAVRDVLRRALATDPAMRPASAQELRSALAGAGGRLARTVVVPRKWPHRVRFAALGLASALVGGAVAAGVGAPAPADPAALQPTIAEMNGVWETPFGMLKLEVDTDGRAYGVYAHEGGVIVGRYYRGVMTGWWCEEPSRRPREDAGLVQMQFVRGPHRILFDGQWKYGDDANTPWVRNWAGFSVDSLPVPDLEKRLQQRTTCAR